MTYDLVLKNCRIVDGCGNPWFRADMALKDGKIVKLSRWIDGEAEETIDVNEMIVCPGFIDPHDHSDTVILQNPTADAKVGQGCTTMLAGNCGSSAAPITEKGRERAELRAARTGAKIDWASFGEYLDKVEKNGVAANFACLVGHSTVRANVVGEDDRAPTDAEMSEMKALVAQSMEGGAFGMSTGLYYVPGQFATTEEVIELAKVVAAYKGIYASHVRPIPTVDWGGLSRDPEGVREACIIGEKAGLPVQISHYETHSPYDRGKENMMLEQLEIAREKGVDVIGDLMPSIWGGSSTQTTLPFWAQEGGRSKILERLRDEETRERIRKDIPERAKYSTPAWFIAYGKPERLRLYRSEKHPEFNWKTLKEIAEIMGTDPLTAQFDLTVEEGNILRFLTKNHYEEDIRTALKHPTSTISTDASAIGRKSIFMKQHTNPRAYGIYPLTFRKYVRGETRPEMPDEIGTKLLTIQEFVRKSTSMTATKMGLFDRGLIREGMWADLVVFNPETFSDVATYEDTHHHPVGVDYVFVNGTLVWHKGKHTGALPGKVLRGPGYKQK